MTTHRAALVEQDSSAAKAPELLVKRLNAYLRGLEIAETARSEMIETVLSDMQSGSEEPTIAEAMAALHVLLGQAQAQTQAGAGSASVRASAAQRTAMWFEASRHGNAVDSSIYLKRPLIKRMSMVSEERPQVQAEGTWRRMMRLYVGQ